MAAQRSVSVPVWASLERVSVGTESVASHSQGGGLQQQQSYTSTSFPSMSPQFSQFHNFIAWAGARGNLLLGTTTTSLSTASSSPMGSIVSGSAGIGGSSNDLTPSGSLNFGLSDSRGSPLLSRSVIGTNGHSTSPPLQHAASAPSTPQRTAGFAGRALGTLGMSGGSDFGDPGSGPGTGIGSALAVSVPEELNGSGVHDTRSDSAALVALLQTEAGEASLQVRPGLYRMKCGGE